MCKGLMKAASVLRVSPICVDCRRVDPPTFNFKDISLKDK
jgi:hypothetical protein